MLTDYIKAAMKRAKYKMVDDPNPFFGEIPELPGLWANGPTLEDCRDELKEVLEGWIIVSLYRGHKIPVLNGIDLNPQKKGIKKATRISVEAG